MKDELGRTSREQLGSWISRTYRRRFQLSEILLEQIGVGPGQVPILLQLSHHGELTQRELAEHTHVTAATISGTLKRMEKAGIVYRTDDNRDARVSIVRLTEKGKEVAEQAHQQFVAADKEMLKGFTESECEMIVSCLERMRENIDAALARINEDTEKA